MVPRAGVEPAQCYHRGILSPLRLPISPPGQIANIIKKYLMCLLSKFYQAIPVKNGGGTRSRTEVDGFAIHCIATLLFRL